MKVLRVFSLILISANLFAQGDLTVKTDGNTGYLTHTVGAKENYYSIGRIYNISPRTYAPYNNLKLEVPMAIGQQVKIPLVQQNFTMDNSGNANEAFVPLYYVVQEKEGLFKIGQHFGITADDLKKLNALKSDVVNIGDKLVIGYLKILKEQSPLAANARVGKPVVKEAGGKVQGTSDKAQGTSDKVQGTSDKVQGASDKVQDVAKTETKKENKPVVKPETSKAEEKKAAVANTSSSNALKEGVFMNEYFLQTNNGSNTQSAETMCGVFKSSSGWGNGKYYALMNGVERGTIVKIMVNGRAVYAKVLDAVPNVKENAGLNVLISNAAAAQLEVSEQKFNVGVMYSK